MKITICLILLVALLNDFLVKYEAEIRTSQREYRTCKEIYTENRCDEPVPGVVELCKEQERCLEERQATETAGFGRYGVKNVNVVVRLGVEIVNDFAKRLDDRTVYILLVFASFLIAIKWLKGENTTQKVQ